MVSSGDIVRRTPEYGLQGIHRLAGFQSVYYAGTPEKLLAHLQRLGYSLSDVCAHLLRLEERHYDRSIQYGGKGRWHDVYLLEHPTDDDPDQRLYIKLAVARNLVLLELFSFHPEGWQ